MCEFTKVINGRLRSPCTKGPSNLIMYFGLCNSPATYQKMMNEIFRDMLDVCIVYIDDLMIFTPMDNQEEHDRIVLKVLKWLHDNDLFVKPEKCHFRVTEVNLL